MIKQLPNSVTVLNLALGFFAIVLTSFSDYEKAIYCIFGSALADLLDGALARILNAYSKLGKELDSLADLVSFGLAPAFLALRLLYEMDTHPFLPYTSVLFLIAAALRLARFNITPVNNDSFIGLPAPAAALTLLGFIGWWIEEKELIISIFTNPSIFLFIVILLLAMLMVSKVQMFSLKTSHFKWKGNEIRYLILLIGLLLFIVVPVAALAITMSCYIIYSVIVHLLLGKNQK